MLERLIIIHNAIKSGLYPNNQQLQRLYCEQTGYSKVGEATINRDIDTLRTYFNAPLEFDRTKGGYYYSDDNFEFALNNISADERQELQTLINQYRSGIVPLIVPLTLLKHHFKRHPDRYIAGQVYLQPHPENLSLRNAI